MELKQCCKYVSDAINISFNRTLWNWNEDKAAAQELLDYF